jgi:hypothetical protein
MVVGNPVRLCGCGVAADGVCPRCDLPLCLAHQPASDRRCAECETLFRRRRPLRLVRYVAALTASAVALVLGLCFLVLATAGGALGVAPLILFGSFPVILHKLERHAREVFLAEHREHHALPRAQLLIR